jgi:uncharacterized protein YndB with AHSA1/START domain
MLKKLLLIVVVALGALAVVVATRPDAYHVERAAKIDAPAEAVFETLSDFKSFSEWSPWAKRDPAMHTTISTPSGGVGASYAWEGNKEVGKGRMIITKADAPTQVRERLEFIEPFASVAEVSFDIKPQGQGTGVTWSMDGKSNFVGKAIALFMDMDKMIGKDFDDGLTGLKRVVEEKHTAAAAAAAAAAPPPPAAPPAGK